MRTGLYVGLGGVNFGSRPEQPSLFMDGTLIGLWVGTALLYPYLSRGVSWVVDTVVLRRPNYEKFQDAVAQEIMRRDTPEAILDQCCAMLKSVLFTEEIEWASTPERETNGPPYGSASRKPIVTRDTPRRRRGTSNGRSSSILH